MKTENVKICRVWGDKNPTVPIYVECCEGNRFAHQLSFEQDESTYTVNGTPLLFYISKTQLLLRRLEEACLPLR